MDTNSQFLLYSWLQTAWIVASGAWFWRRRDELPLVISIFLLYVFSFRFWALLNRLADPVNISQYGFDPMTFDLGAQAQAIALLSETCLLGAYMLIQKRTLAVTVMRVSPGFLQWLRPFVFGFSALAIPVSIVARARTGALLEGGKVMAFEVSAYLYELPFVLISVALLLALLWKCGGLRTPPQRGWALFIVAWVLILTFNPNTRFQFLGWILATSIILCATDSLPRRVLVLTLGFGAALVLFGVAGALRSDEQDLDLRKAGWERLFFAEDANMLDGLVLLRQVYPERLSYTYGGGLLEILERPIPRALWPGKPVGGYMNKLGLTSVDTGGTLGISPGLVGSFYQEGGVAAVIILSCLFGYALGRLVSYSTKVTPFAGALIRAICCASLIPLLRGGDLPGVFAWIFMSFWPSFFVLWRGRRELFAGRALPPKRRRPLRNRPTRPSIAPS